ncbi:recombinase family protein [Nonomuraea bangladeshensis]
MVPELARYGRSLHDLITMVAELRRREIGFTSLHEKLDTTTPGGAGLPRLRRPGRVHPRAHRGRHPRGPGRRACPRPHRRLPHRRHPRTPQGRPRPAARPRTLAHLHRQAARRLGRHPVQPHPRPARDSRRPAASSHAEGLTLEEGRSLSWPYGRSRLTRGQQL